MAESDIGKVKLGKKNVLSVALREFNSLVWDS